MSWDGDSLLSKVRRIINNAATDQYASLAETQTRSQQLFDRIFGNQQVGLIQSVPEIPECSGLRLVAWGGMGLVYQAHHDVLNMEVAVKILRPGSDADPTRIARFIREIQMQARLRSDYIVAVRSAGKVDEQPYVVMDWVDGLDCERVARAVQQLDVNDACEISRQAALGLAHAHQFQTSDGQGLIHRDIKPSNLLLSSEGRVLVADFGLAIIASSDSSGDDASPRLTEQGEFLGTPNYAAPEQLRVSRTADVRTDIYSLGLTLWRLLSGEIPFAPSDGPRSTNRVSRSSTRELPDIRQFRTDVPRRLARLIDKMTETHIEGRPPSANEVARELSLFCRDANLRRLVERAQSGPREDSPDRPKQSRRIRTWISELIAVGILAAAALIVVIIKTEVGDVKVEVDTETGRVTRIEEPDAVGRPGANPNTSDGSTTSALPQPKVTARATLQRLLDCGGQVLIRDKQSGAMRTFGRSVSLPDDLSGVFHIEVVNTQLLRDEDLIGLDQFPELEVLRLNGTPLTNAGLSHIGKLTQLRELSVFATRITDPGIAQLRGLTQLQTLHLAITDITDDSLQHLSRMRRLEWLALVKCSRISGSGFQNLGELQQLKYLDMNMTALNDDGLHWIAQLQGLEQLHATSTPISDEGLAEVARLKNLKELHPNDTGITDEGVVHLTECKELVGLGLNGTQISDRSLSVIAGLSELKLLALQYTATTDTGLRELTDLHHLQSLLLVGTRVSDSGVAELRQALPNCRIDFPSLDYRVADRCLEFGGSVQFHGAPEPLTHRSQLVRDDQALIQSIDLTRRKLPPELLTNIARLQTLHSLKLTATSVTPTDLRQLAASPELRYLWLVDTNVDDACVEFFAGSQTLTLLDLSGTKISDAALAHVPQSLNSLYLNRTATSDDGLAKLAHLQRLTELRVEDTQVTADGMRELQHALPKCRISR
ncbi:MAG: protein kinase [Planctomycetales bacterium]|nr:protein kinase [Planctomycetales bacterium]